MLSIGGIRSTPKGQQPASSKKTLRHLAAGLGQTRRLPHEELLEQKIPFEQSLFHLAGEFSMRRAYVFFVAVFNKCAVRDRQPAYPRSGFLRKGFVTSTVPAGCSRTSPITWASLPPGARLSALIAASAYSGETTARNWPSFAI